ncbi:MAG: hypothetical protein ABWY26_04275, partial [Microbacterium sp.]
KERRAARRAGSVESDAVTGVLEPELVGAGAVGAGPVLTRRELRAREAAAVGSIAAEEARVEVPPVDEGPDIEMPEGDASADLSTDAQDADPVAEQAEEELDSPDVDTEAVAEVGPHDHGDAHADVASDSEEHDDRATDGDEEHRDHSA